MVENIIIIGSGPGGLSSAIYTAREEFKPLILGGFNSGGQLLLTTLVENIPGFPEGIDGPEFIKRLQAQAQKFGARIKNEDVINVDFKSKPFKIITNENIYEAYSVIIATGANSKELGIPNEKKFYGRGISECATCDAPLFKNKDNVIVVGGGDTAMEDADFLTKYVKNVTIVHRRNEFRASKIMQEKVLSNPKIKIIWDSSIEEILGENILEGARIINYKTNEKSIIKAQGIFLAIGRNPNTKFLQNKLELDDQGYIATKNGVFTSVEGVFAVGDCADRFYKQAGTATGDGIKAALRVREYLSKLNIR
ncbi:MAG: thioredoxin-disulfide reductase [Candidatus Marsarchaeota archaeon]|jgi:thioredoxin reductase (NADPH)|nr:thioredoxin-disulfide reductase [Candidatus Marsarchaeota archaeon]